MVAIPTTRQRKDATLLLFSLLALGTQPWVGIRCLQSIGTASTPALALERWPSTLRTPTLRLALQRCYQTPLVLRTWPMDTWRFPTTPVAATTTLSALLRSITILTDRSITPSETRPSHRTYTPA